MVPEIEEREAAVFAGYRRPEWESLPWHERARTVAHFRLHHLIRLHAQEAEVMRQELSARTPSPTG